MFKWSAKGIFYDHIYWIGHFGVSVQGWLYTLS